jgi:hypothetical protein
MRVGAKNIGLAGKIQSDKKRSRRCRQKQIRAANEYILRDFKKKKIKIVQSSIISYTKALERIDKSAHKKTSSLRDSVKTHLRNTNLNLVETNKILSIFDKHTEDYLQSLLQGLVNGAFDW